MDKKEIMEEIEKFDINNVEFNYDSISPWKILELSPKLHQTFEKLDSKRFSKKRREFISLFFECLSEWMSQPDKQKQAVINTVIKRFEPMQLTKDQIQTIIETYGCISEEEAKCIKRAYVTKRLLESQSQQE